MVGPSFEIVFFPPHQSFATTPNPPISTPHYSPLLMRGCWAREFAVGLSKMQLRMACSGPKTHLVMVGVEAAHQLTTVRLLLLLKLAEGRREKEEKEGRGGPTPHGKRGQVCARGGRELDCAPAHRLDWSTPNPRPYLQHPSPLLVCMSTGL